jgi:hypothetical protein
MRTLLNGVERVLTGLQSDVWHTSRRVAALLLIAALAPQAPAECDPQEVGQLLASDAAAHDHFGFSAALSGDTAVFGAWSDDHAAGNGAGSAYVFIRSNGVWKQQAKLTASDAATDDYFGLSVAISGDTAVIGAPWNDHEGGTDAGAAYVFTRSHGFWFQQAKLTASDAADFDIFGYSVAVSGDTAVIGAYGDDHAGGNSAGSAYVFVRSGETWIQQAKLTAADAAPYDEFGVCVAVSGDTAVVGAWLDDGAAIDTGSAYVFVRTDEVWTQQAKLTASDAEACDQFGSSVAVSSDTALVGAIYDDHGGLTDAGSAYVFVRSESAWLQQAKLTASDAAARDEFGVSVAVSGDSAVVGAWLGGESGATDAGSAYVFVRAGDDWTEQAELTGSNAAAGDDFGNSVALSGNTAVIGAPCTDHAENTDAGSAYVFDLNCQGVCCFSNGSCAKMIEAECDGVWHFEWADCAEAHCPPPTGACCLPGGICQVMTKAECAAEGGVYRNHGSSCEPDPCSERMGACCLTDRGCQVGTEDYCVAAGGVYQGDDISCAAAQCPHAPCANILKLRVEGEGAVEAAPALDIYDCGAVVELSATPAPCWHFVGWEGPVADSSGVATVTMYGNKTVTAVFAIDKHVLEVSVEGAGRVALSPEGGIYDCGSTVQLTATPEPGWHFAGWRGDAAGASTSNSILMDGERHATAVFEADETDDASSGQEAPQSALCSGISGALIGLTLIGLMRSGRTARRRST